MKIDFRYSLRFLLALLDLGVLAGAFFVCDVAAEALRPGVYDLLGLDRQFQPHPSSMYYMLPVAGVLYVMLLAVTGFYVWDWWSPRRLALGAVVVAILFGMIFSVVVLFFQRDTYPRMHVALLVPVLGGVLWLTRVLLMALPGFRTLVDRRYPVVKARGPETEGSKGAGVRKVSLLTVHYREPRMWDSFQKHLLAKPPKTPFELIVADNSPEYELEVLPELAPDTTIVPLKNPGFAGGINEAFRYSSGDVLGVFNLDVELRGDVVDRAVAQLAANPQAGVLLPQLNNPDGGRQHSVRRFYDWRTALYARFPLRPFLPTPRFFRHYLMADATPAEPICVDWGLGAAMFIRRASVAGQRIFDPRYFLYFEDVDLCWNMWRRGWQVLYDPQLVCVHQHARRSARGPLRGYFYHHLTSFLMFALKHGGLHRPQEGEGAITRSAADRSV